MLQTVPDYKGDQTELRDWLKKIDGSLRGRKEVEEKIRKLMQRTIHAAVTFADGRVQYRYGVSGVEGLRALAVALILSDNKGLSKRLRECGGCGKFNLDFEPKGRPRRFCNPECKRAYEKATGAERVAKWRANSKKKKISLKRLDQ